MDSRTDFEDRIQPYLDRGWDLQPEPYRIRNEDGSPGPWKSRVLVLHHSFSETTVRSICCSRKYPEQNYAAWGAVLIGLDWLEQNA